LQVTFDICKGETMKKTPLALAVAVAAAAVVLPDLAAAQAGSWIVRARATQINPADKSDAIPSLGVPADAVTSRRRCWPSTTSTRQASSIPISAPASTTRAFRMST
jgi:outer membrane protein W